MRSKEERRTKSTMKTRQLAVVGLVLMAGVLGAPVDETNAAADAPCDGCPLGSSTQAVWDSLSSTAAGAAGGLSSFASGAGSAIAEVSQAIAAALATGASVAVAGPVRAVKYLLGADAGSAESSSQQTRALDLPVEQEDESSGEWWPPSAEAVANMLLIIPVCGMIFCFYVCFTTYLQRKRKRKAKGTLRASRAPADPPAALASRFALRRKASKMPDLSSSMPNLGPAALCAIPPTSPVPISPAAGPGRESLDPRPSSAQTTSRPSPA